MTDTVVVALLVVVCVLVALVLVFLLYLCKGRNGKPPPLSAGAYNYGFRMDDQQGILPPQIENSAPPGVTALGGTPMDATALTDDVRRSIPCSSHSNRLSVIIPPTTSDSLNVELHQGDEAIDASLTMIDNDDCNMQMRQEASSVSIDKMEQTPRTSHETGTSEECIPKQDSDHEEDCHIYSSPTTEPNCFLASNDVSAKCVTVGVQHSDTNYYRKRTLPALPFQDNPLGTKTVKVTAVRMYDQDSSVVSVRVFCLSSASGELLSDVLQRRNVKGEIITVEPIALRPLGKLLNVTVDPDCIHGGELLSPKFSTQTIDFNLAWDNENPSVTFHFNTKHEAIFSEKLIFRLTVAQDDLSLSSSIDVTTPIYCKANTSDGMDEINNHNPTKEPQYADFMPTAITSSQPEGGLYLTLNDHHRPYNTTSTDANGYQHVK